MTTVERVTTQPRSAEPRRAGSVLVVERFNGLLDERRAQPSGLGEPELYALRDTSYVYAAKWREALASSALPPRPRGRGRTTAHVPTEAEEFVRADIAEQQVTQRIALEEEKFATPEEAERYRSFRGEVSALVTRLDHALQPEVRRDLAEVREGRKPNPQDTQIEVYRRIADFLTMQGTLVTDEVKQQLVAEHAPAEKEPFFSFLDRFVAQDMPEDQGGHLRSAAMLQLYFYYKDRTSLADLSLRSKRGPYTHLDTDEFSTVMRKHFPDYKAIDDPYRRPLSTRTRQEERNARRRIVLSGEDADLSAYNTIYNRWMATREEFEADEAAAIAETGDIPQALVEFATVKSLRDKFKTRIGIVEGPDNKTGDGSSDEFKAELREFERWNLTRKLASAGNQ